MEHEQLLIRPREGAKAYGVSLSKFYEMIKTGQIPSVRLGKRALRVPVAALKRLADSTMVDSEK